MQECWVLIEVLRERLAKVADDATILRTATFLALDEEAYEQLVELRT